MGATDDRDTVTRADDGAASFTNVGPRADDGDWNRYDELKPDVVAPVVNLTLLKYSSLPVQVQPASGYVGGQSGTSFATPIVAGVVALMLEANPSLTTLQIKRILQETAEQHGAPAHPDYPFPHNKWNASFGYGIVDAYAAVVAARDYHAPVLVTPQFRDCPTNVSNSTYKLSWTEVSGTEAYLLQEADGKDPGLGFVHPFEFFVLHPTASTTLAGRENGTYLYRVKAANEIAESIWSDSIAVIVKIITGNGGTGNADGSGDAGRGLDAGTILLAASGVVVLAAILALGAFLATRRKQEEHPALDEPIDGQFDGQFDEQTDGQVFGPGALEKQQPVTDEDQTGEAVEDSWTRP